MDDSDDTMDDAFSDVAASPEPVAALGVVPFPGADSGTMRWQLLNIAKATRSADHSLARAHCATEGLIAAALLEARLGADAVELCATLERLTQDIDTLRQYYH